jgi:hypothetical protein
MNWQTFKATLEKHPDQYLQFQYAEGIFVDQAFHITEIKQAPITSVDCGGVMNKWTEIIVQLYEPLAEQQDRSMKVEKALSIINLVERALPLDGFATVKIEFGNSTFDTRQMLPNAIITERENLVVDLRADTVQCKANERGGSCGPAAEAKPKIQLQNLATNNTCTPGGGCC